MSGLALRNRAPLKQSDDQDHDSNHQEQMDQAACDVEAESQRPHDYQD
jgi:hypothetical protein